MRIVHCTNHGQSDSFCAIAGSPAPGHRAGGVRRVVAHAGALPAKQRPHALRSLAVSPFRADIEDALLQQQQAPPLHRKPDELQRKLL
jgi:hypothetical protein